jgi:HlyD family secretion protein
MMRAVLRWPIRHKAMASVVVLAVSSVAVYGLMRYMRHAPTVPTFAVKRGEFVEALQLRGELKAMKTVSISAPSNAGDLQILKLAADGSVLKEGDVVAEFDPSKTQQELARDQSTLKSAQAEIEQARAVGVLAEEKDRTAVMKAQYDVGVAKLEASKGEIVSKIDGGEALLILADAEQALRAAQATLKSDQALDRATVEDKVHASSKAGYDVQRAQGVLGYMTLKAPTGGTISLIPTWHDGSSTPFKAGDRAWAGAPIAELPDVSTLRVSARVDESERGRLSLSQPATVQLDAISDRQFTGKIERIGTIASSDFSAGWPFPMNFSLEIGLDQTDPRLRPGMAVQITVIVGRVADAITIPTQASFLKFGQTVAYVWDGSRFEERTIQIERRSHDRALISSGLRAGDLVALQDPTVKQ